jgi:hypothetical protein
MQVKKRFEVKCPALWSEIDTFEEPMYEEVVKIVKGVGYCDSPNSAERLRNFGYTIRDLYLEKEKAYDDKQQESNKDRSTTQTKAKSKGRSKARK